MNSTERFFVKCVDAGIKNSCVLTVDEGVDFKQLYNLCVSHSMCGVVLKALEGVSDKLHERFWAGIQNSARRHLMRDVLGEQDVTVLLSEFENRGIKYLPLKGFHLKKLYPSTEMRYASDFDILIDINQLKEVRRVVKDLNLEVKRFDEHHDVVYSPETKTVFELHKSVFVGKLSEFFGIGFERARLKDGYKCFYEFGVEDFYISILAHSAYHFAESAGVGIRHLTDVYLYKNAYEIDYSYLDAELEKCGLLSFKNEFERLADYFFNGAEASEFTLKLADYVLESSLLANERKQHASSVASNGEEVDSKKAKKQALFRIFFPKLEVMKFIFPVLKKVIILLPFCYVYRWGQVLFTRPKQIKKLKKVVEAEEKDIDEVKYIRKNLGINDL